MWQSGPRVWDVTTGQEVTPSAGLHHASVDVVRHDPNPNVLYSWAREKKMVRWDLATGAGADHFTGPDDGLFYTAGAISPDGRRIAAVTIKDPTIKLWDVKTGRLIRDVFQLPTEDRSRFWLYSLTFSPDGTKLAAGGTDGHARIWDVESGKMIAEWKGGKLGRPVAAVRFTPSGSEVFIGVSRGKTPFGAVVRWDFAKDRTVKWVNVSQDVTNFAVSPDATRAVICSDHGSSPAIWDLVAGKQLVRLAAHPRGSYATAFSPDGQYLATGGEDKDNTVRVWDATNGQELATFSGPPAAAMCLTFTPDGRRLIAGYGDSTILVWDLTGRSGALGPVPKSLDEAWRRLAAAGGTSVLPAAFAFTDDPATGLDFLKRHVRPAVAPNPADVAKHVAALDAPAFAERESATVALHRLGQGALPALRNAIAAANSAETRERLQKIVDRLETGGDATAFRRAVAIMREMGTADAKTWLETLSTGDPAAPLTTQAKAALR
jgi:WD40 repeat protein